MATCCNSCGKEISGQALTTFCSHCYCLECANAICQGDNTCPVCGSQLDGSNVVSEALVFNETQRHIANKFQAKTHKGKCKHIVDSSKAKMAEMHKSYKNLVQKAKSITQDKMEKQSMLEELRKKAQESSRICRKLQDQLKTQQIKTSVLHQQVGNDHGLSPTSSGAGRLPAMNNSRNQSRALVPFGKKHHQGHISHNVCAPHQKLLQQHSHSSKGVPLNGFATTPLTRHMHPSHRSAGAQPSSPTLGAVPTPSDWHATSLSGRSGSGVSALLQGTGVGNRDANRRQSANLGTNTFNRHRQNTVPSPMGSSGSLSDLIKSHKR